MLLQPQDGWGLGLTPSDFLRLPFLAQGNLALVPGEGRAAGRLDLVQLSRDRRPSWDDCSWLEQSFLLTLPTRQFLVASRMTLNLASWTGLAPIGALPLLRIGSSQHLCTTILQTCFTHPSPHLCLSCGLSGMRCSAVPRMTGPSGLQTRLCQAPPAKRRPLPGSCRTEAQQVLGLELCYLSNKTKL